MKRIALLFVVTALLVLAGCTTTDSETPLNYNPFIGGKQAIQAEFVQGMPPSEEGAILDNGRNSFGVGVKLTNVGEHDIEENDFLELELRGILPEQFGLTSSDLVNSLDQPLPGAKKLLDGSTQPGQFATLTFDDLSYRADATGDVPRTFQVNLCYDYVTKSTTPVCITDDVTDAITNEDDRSICNVNEAKITKNSAGPVQITSFKQLPQGGSKISLIFTVEHVGSGNVFKVESDNKCNYRLQNNDKNKVHLKMYLPDESDTTLSCMGGEFTKGSLVEGDITLYEGNPRTVTCTIEGDNARDIIYEDLLHIDMSYRYGETLEKTVMIKDVGSANED